MWQSLFGCRVIAAIRNARIFGAGLRKRCELLRGIEILSSGGTADTNFTIFDLHISMLPKLKCFVPMRAQGRRDTEQIADQIDKAEKYGIHWRNQPKDEI